MKQGHVKLPITLLFLIIKQPEGPCLLVPSVSLNLHSWHSIIEVLTDFKVHQFPLCACGTESAYVASVRMTVGTEVQSCDLLK